MQLSDLQAKQEAWSIRNFPNRNPDHPLLGVIEEVGELAEAFTISDADYDNRVQLIVEMAAQLGRLAHVTLKQIQKIRKASATAEREAAALDQLSDILETYATVIGHEVRRVDPEGEHYDESPERAKDAVGDITVYLADLCSRKGWSYDEIVESVLAEVLARDWNKKRTEEQSVGAA